MYEYTVTGPSLFVAVAFNVIALLTIFYSKSDLADRNDDHTYKAIYATNPPHVVPNPFDEPTPSPMLETDVNLDCSGKPITDWTNKQNPAIEGEILNYEVKMRKIVEGTRDLGNNNGCPHKLWLDWSESLYKRGKHVYSQHKEDGITLAIFEKIGTTNKFYLEFGVQTGKECNSRILRENGWSGRMFDNENSNKMINITKASIWLENMEKLFSTYKIPKRFDYFSLDTNMNDHWYMEQFLQLGYRPRVVVVETNHNFPFYASLATPKQIVVDHKGFDGASYHQATLLAMTKLMNKYGYNLVTHHTFNPFYILKSEMNNVDLALLKWVGVMGGQPESWIQTPVHRNDGRAMKHLCAGDKCRSNADW